MCLLMTKQNKMVLLHAVKTGGKSHAFFDNYTKIIKNKQYLTISKVVYNFFTYKNKYISGIALLFCLVKSEAKEGEGCWQEIRVC